MASKELERLHVEFLVRKLGLGWQLVDIPEPPDFEVRTPTEVFGLEHSHFYSDSKGASGSQAKREESERQRVINQIQRAYYARGGKAARALFLGRLRGVDVLRVVRALLENQPADGRESTVEVNGLKVSLRTVIPGQQDVRWILVDDQVGWLGQISSADLQRAVDRKADRLAAYLQKYSIVDLVLVADRRFNSARLDTADSLFVRNPGFRAIYFVSFPFSAIRVESEV